MVKYKLSWFIVIDLLFVAYSWDITRQWYFGSGFLAEILNCVGISEEIEDNKKCFYRSVMLVLGSR